MKCLTWNLEWTPPNSLRADLILGAIRAIDRGVVCYTEVNLPLIPDGHVVEANPDYRYPIKEGRRKVALWSKSPWQEVDLIGDSEMLSGSFVSGVTHGIRYVGVCIP